MISPSTTPSTPHLIESLRVTDGYLRNITLSYSHGLNTIIGGRGVGKSTGVEILRFALGAPGVAAHDEHVKATLAGGRATVRVRTRHGVRYEVSRAHGEPPRVRSADSGEVVDVSLDSDLFRIEVYGQGEIERVATSPSAQLALIDRFAESDARRLADAIAHGERRFLAHARDVLREEQIHADEDRTQDLSSLEEALRVLRQGKGPDAAEAARAHEEKAARSREAAAIAQATAELALLKNSLDAFTKEAARRLGGALDPEASRGPNAKMLATVGDQLRKVAHTIEETASRIRDDIARAEDVVGETRRGLSAAHAKQEDAYQAFVARQDEDRGRAAERTRLETRLVELKGVARVLVEKKRAHAARRAEQAQMVAEHVRLRRELYALRAKVAAEITAGLDGDVRVSVMPGQNLEAYDALLEELLHGANIRPASLVKEIVTNIRPDDLYTMVEENDGSAIVAIDDSKTGKPERARRILDVLRATGRAFELQTVKVEDVPLIELRTAAGYKASKDVSTGQRCTCVLPILLLRADSPLVIDQPEDHLDNAFIYDVFVKRVSATKASRQFVFVTHNPNIPVLGDAERVIVIESDDKHARVAEAGTVDEVRGSIERILEGGREAFLRRSERYGHTK